VILVYKDGDVGDHGTSGERSATLGGFLIDRDEFLPDVRRLSRVDNLKGALSIGRQWGVIALAIAAAVWSHHWALWVAAVIVIATRQHALAVIMHEAAHYRVFTNRRVNELISDCFCAYPLGLATQLYRKQHLEHHQFTNSDRDPNWVEMSRREDWRWPKDHLTCARLFLKDVGGLHLHKMFLLITLWSPWPRVARIPVETFLDNPLTPSEQRRWLMFMALVTALLTVTHSWIPFLILWSLPLLTLLGALMRMRTVAEHLMLEGTHELNSTRHVDATLLERLSIAPLNSNYHIAHHLFPSVPQYNLPRLHALLMQNETFRRHAASVKTYLGRSGGMLQTMTRRASD
jgi:fatty acid desaturase